MRSGKMSGKQSFKPLLVARRKTSFVCSDYVTVAGGGGGGGGVLFTFSNILMTMSITLDISFPNLNSTQK